MGLWANTSYFSLSITPSGCHSDASEWVLDTGSTYDICLRRELFTSFEKLDGRLMSMRDDYTCRLFGKDTVRIKMYDGTMRELKDVRYTSYSKELDLSWSFGSGGPERKGILKMFSGSLVVLKGIRQCTT